MIAKYRNCYSPAYRDDFFNDQVSQKYYGRGFASTPAVNIIEENDGFRIEVAAAGLSKEDFKIHLEDDVLTVSAEKEQDEKDAQGKYTRREFNYTSFKRSFRLDETIDQERVEAEHKDGILNIRLSKREDSVKQGPKSIEIS
jgi:HSP20 family protein